MGLRSKSQPNRTITAEVVRDQSMAAGPSALRSSPCSEVRCSPGALVSTFTSLMVTILAHRSGSPGFESSGWKPSAESWEGSTGEGQGKEREKCKKKGN